MKIFMVGGAVRDLVMGTNPVDRDFVVVGSSHEEMVSMGFVPIEAQSFPVFHHPRTKEEFALARRERKTGSGYHGFEVDTGEVTLEEDLSRRDLTLNAMAIPVSLDKENRIVFPEWPLQHVIDPFGGKDSISSQVMRHTSHAFSEDPVRVLRLARFAARFGFSIHPDTLVLCEQMVRAGELNFLTTERVWLETEKAVAGPRPGIFFKNLREIGVPGPISAVYAMNWNQEIDRATDLTVPEKFAMSFIDTVKDGHDIEQILRAVGANNQVIKVSKGTFFAFRVLKELGCTGEAAVRLMEITNAKQDTLFLESVVRISRHLRGGIFHQVAGELSSAIRVARKIGFKDLTSNEKETLSGIGISGRIREISVSEADEFLKQRSIT